MRVLKDIADLFKYKKNPKIGDALREIKERKTNHLKIVQDYLDEVVPPFYHELKRRAQEDDIFELELYWEMGYVYPPKVTIVHVYKALQKRPHTMFPIPKNEELKDKIRMALERRFLDDGLQVVYQETGKSSFIFTVRW